MIEPEYLGDGVYMQEDEFGQLVLSTDSHILLNARNIIYIELPLLKHLKQYVEKLENQ
jgi:hypothetical protein